MTPKTHSLPIAGFVLAALAATTTTAGAQTPVNQSVINSGAVTVAPVDQTITLPNNASVSGPGASLTVNATGAAASVGIAGINVDFSAPVLDPVGPPVTLGLGAVTQTTTNQVGGTVTAPGASTHNIGATGSNGFSLFGPGTSASVSSTGAVSSVGVTGISGATPTTYSALAIESVHQTTTNSANVQTGTPAERGRIVIRGASGAGSSASVSATGAASAVSSTFINAAGANTATGAIYQNTTTTGGTTSNFGHINHTLDPAGAGASISVTATSAISSVAGIVIGGTGSVITGFAVGGTIDQNAATFGTTENTGSIALGVGANANLQGPGSTATVSATGAASAVSATAINAVSPVFAAGNIDQDTWTNGSVTNSAGSIGSQANIVGNGASAAISATGAISSVAATAIATSADAASFTFGNIDQFTSTTGSVTNTGNIALSGTSSFRTAIVGAGASASISASGAASVVAGTFIATGGYELEIGNVGSTAHNSATVTNNNGAGGGGTLTLHQGGIAGPGASASVSASGATAALSITSIANTGVPAPGSIDVGHVNQNAQNLAGATIINNGGTIALNNLNGDNPGNISGAGAAASISASGAAAAFSLSSINDTGSLAGVANIASISQTAGNAASVTNTGRITLSGGITGAGASASVSAVGAGAYTSFSAIRATP